MNAGLKKVIILEDAESLLENAGSGRKGAVANLLNISDGLLGELLKSSSSAPSTARSND